MGIDFRIKDFAYPLGILKLKKTFDRNQWLSEKELYEYQLSRLKIIVDHAYKNVPYYHDLFEKSGILPGDIKQLEDLKKMPFLTKETLKDSPDVLTAKDVKKYNPRTISTSGTTGGNVKFLIDKSSNILEFVFYWRYWGWAGYRLGDRFAEFSAQHFTPFEDKKDILFDFEHVTRRLLVNSLLISHENAERYINIFKRFKPLFLKGLPSNLYMFALILNKKKNHDITFKAVFSQGENLLRFQKDLIEKTFLCKVYDSYGHMERTVAISQCPSGSYHIHPDYGIAEFEKSDMLDTGQTDSGNEIKEIVGTSLYNFSMPLIRYRTGDFVKISRSSKQCPCGRKFPMIDSIIGRGTDIIFTPDKRAVTALYVALDRTPGILFGQIVQDSIDRLVIKVATDSKDMRIFEQGLIKNMRDFVGDSMKIDIEYISIDEIKKDETGKFKVVVSKIQPVSSPGHPTKM